MSDIPAARAILADALPGMPEPWCAKVREALALMTRKPCCKHRAPPQKRPVDPELAARIRAYVASNPRAHVHDIAQTFGTTQGRVTEALQGVR